MAKVCMGVAASFDEKRLKDWAGWKIYRNGQALFERGVVEQVTFKYPLIAGTLNLGPRGMRSRFEILANGLVENHCPCRDNQERGLICSHLVALGLSVLENEAQADAGCDSERAERIARSARGSRIRRARKSTPGALHATLRLELGESWWEELDAFKISLAVFVDDDSESRPIAEIASDTAVYLTRSDDQLAHLLERFGGGGIKNRITLSIAQFIEVLQLFRGRSLSVNGPPGRIEVDELSVDSSLSMDMDRESGELLLELDLAGGRQSDAVSRYLVGERMGWVCYATRFQPLATVLPASLRDLYRMPLRIPREQVPSFLMSDLVQIEKKMFVKKAITQDLFFMKPAKPTFRLVVKGSPGALAARLYACYDERFELIAGRADMRGNFAIPDPRDLLKYRIRNMEAEKHAVEKLKAVGFEGRAGDTLRNIEGVREVLNFLGTGIPQVRRMGWRVELEGRVKPFVEQADYVQPVVRVDESDGDYFEITCEYDLGTGSLSDGEIKAALARGNSFVEREGKTILLDGDAIMQAMEVFESCSPDKSQQQKMRLDGIHGSYALAALKALEGIDIQASPHWLKRAQLLNEQDRVEKVEPSRHLKGTLRAYQQEGLNWLRFLECCGFCGILADEMGLGKTLQTLAWIQLKRADESHCNKPTLVICPTSLVETWREETARFTPNLKALTLYGGTRHLKWNKVKKSDIVITSYALMKRDIEKHLEYNYAIAVLDEAQHIKNHTTQNALTAKRIRADHRLVISGTPIENSVTDLWSIMDFLIPGYLGDHKSFREQYERPILSGGNAGELVQARLCRKLHPFLLRRLKKHVAKDLPPKIEHIAPCKLTQDQHKVYRQLLEESKARIEQMVGKDGFNKSRMEILKTLLRLRQTCNHIDLLKLDGPKSKHPSAKMDVFFSLLGEAIDSRHRVLVFSQFTSMLAILRKEMEPRQMKYCYLDGSTKDRQEVVHLFNRDHTIPVFLMSLKAGGTGLNLTGADMVILFDPWWNPAVENQATDRAHRIGQKRTVYSVKLITKGTIEDKVLAMQNIKKTVTDSTLKTDEQVMKKLTWEDVQELLTL